MKNKTNTPRIIIFSKSELDETKKKTAVGDALPIPATPSGMRSDDWSVPRPLFKKRTCVFVLWKEVCFRPQLKLPFDPVRCFVLIISPQLFLCCQSARCDRTFHSGLLIRFQQRIERAKYSPTHLFGFGHLKQDSTSPSKVSRSCLCLTTVLDRAVRAIALNSEILCNVYSELYLWWLPISKKL